MSKMNIDKLNSITKGRPAYTPRMDERNFYDLEHRAPALLHTLTALLKVVKVKVSAIQTSDLTLTNEHDLVLVDSSGGRVTITLPSAATYPFKQYWIKKVDKTSIPVIVEPDGVEEIDGESKWLINFQYDTMSIVSDGTSEWHMV